MKMYWQKFKKWIKWLVFGSVVLAAPLAFWPDNARVVEVPEKRTLTAKVFQHPSGETNRFIAKISTRAVHYHDGAGFKDIELPLVSENAQYWKNKANRFTVRIPKVATQATVAEINGKQVLWRPILVSPIQPVLKDAGTDFYGDPIIGNVAYYADAWLNTDLEYTSGWNGLKTNIIIKNASAPASFSFQMITTGLNHSFSSTSPKMLRFSDGAQDLIYVPELTAHDSSSLLKKVPLTTFLQTRGVNTFLDISYDPTGAVYPIIIDPINTFEPATGSGGASVDGAMQVPNSDTWQIARDSATATVAARTDTTFRIASRTFDSTDSSRVNRGVITFATGDTINGGTVNQTTSTYVEVKLVSVSIGDNDGDDFISVIKPNLASTNDIVTGDFDSYDGLPSAMTEQNATGQRADASTTGAGGTANIDLNATGVGNIAAAAGGVTQFGLGEGHDIINVTTAALTENEIDIYASDHATEPGPILSVDYTAVAGAESGGKGLKYFIISLLIHFAYAWHL